MNRLLGPKHLVFGGGGNFPVFPLSDPRYTHDPYGDVAEWLKAAVC